jgi:hypothetical protein
MKTSRYSDSQILAILKQAESGTPVPALSSVSLCSGSDATNNSRLELYADIALFGVKIERMGTTFTPDA